MSKSRKKIVLVSGLAVVIIAVSAFFIIKAVSADRLSFRTPVRILHNPKVTWAEPVAEMRNSGGESWSEVEPGLMLEVDSSIRTGNFGSVDVSFSEGTLIRIAEDTIVDLSDFTLSKTVIELKKGSLISKFSKVTGEEIHRIITPEIVCGIRGTELIVEIGTGETIVYGMSGVTEVASVHHPDNSVLLGFQQKTRAGNGERPGSPVKMTAEEVSHYRRILDSMHSSEVFFITSDLKFKPDSPELIDESMEMLGELAAVIKRKKLSIEIVGHTADIGNRIGQYDLSRRRAEAVKQAFISMGINENRLTTAGYGGSRPIADNDTAEGRALNRRVEFLIRE